MSSTSWSSATRPSWPVRSWPRRAAMPFTEPGPPVPVLFIAGSGRCGSTLVDRILGGYEGVFAAGEIRNLWDRGWSNHGRCGCGRPIRECPVWSGVVAATLADHPHPDPDTLARVMDHDLQARRIPAMMFPPTHAARLERLGAVIATLDSLY